MSFMDGVTSRTERDPRRPAGRRGRAVPGAAPDDPATAAAVAAHAQ